MLFATLRGQPIHSMFPRRTISYREQTTRTTNVELEVQNTDETFKEVTQEAAKFNKNLQGSLNKFVFHIKEKPYK